MKKKKKKYKVHSLRNGSDAGTITFSPKKLLIYAPIARTVHNSSVFDHRLISMEPVVCVSVVCCEYSQHVATPSTDIWLDLASTSAHIKFLILLVARRKLNLVMMKG